MFWLIFGFGYFEYFGLVPFGFSVPVFGSWLIVNGDIKTCKFLTGSRRRILEKIVKKKN